MKLLDFQVLKSGLYDGRNSLVKNAVNCFECNTKKFAWKFLIVIVDS